MVNNIYAVGIAIITIIVVNSKTVSDSPTQYELNSILVLRLSSKWVVLGIQLDVTGDQLEAIRKKGYGEDSCLKDVLIMWKEYATDACTCKPYTWAIMLDVLRSGEINEGKLASELEQKFKPQHKLTRNISGHLIWRFGNWLI